MRFTQGHPLWLPIFLLAFLSSNSRAADLVLGWDANTEADLAGYKIYYGTASSVYSAPITVGIQNSYRLTGLQDGTWYFAVTAVDTLGAESGFSNEVVKSIDTTAPAISALNAINVLSSGATVTWTTSEPSDTLVEYGLTTAYGSKTALNATLVTAHSQAITGLAANTVYHYRAVSKDAAGNAVYSPDRTFTTAPSADQTPPFISAVTASSITASGAIISWTTDEASDSMVQYGATTNYTSAVSDQVRATQHALTLSNLNANTEYHFQVLSKDSAGNLAASGDYRFTTAALPDQTPPQLTGIGAVGPTSSGMTIVWSTNEPADSLVEYGPSTAYGTTASNREMVTAHSVSLNGLAPGTTYHFRVSSTDANGNIAVSGDFTFNTSAFTTAIPKFVQMKEMSVISGGSVTVRFPYSNTAGNLIVAYVVWDNSGSVQLTDTRGNAYMSAVGPTKFSGDRTNAQIFYAKNIRGGTNKVKATFSTPVTSWGILYVHEYSGLDKTAPFESATSGTGSASLMNTGTLVTGSANCLLFAGAESSGNVTLGSNHYTVRSNKYGNLTEDWIAASPGAYSAAAIQDSSAWVMQMAAFKAEAQALAQTTMALPMRTSASDEDAYLGLALVNSDASPATLTITAVDSAGSEMRAPGISNPAIRTLNPGEQLRVVDRELFGNAIGDANGDGWIRLESTTRNIGGYYAVFNEDLSIYHGGSVTPEPLRSIILPEVGSPGRTKITVVNPYPEPGVVSFDVVGPNGVVQRSATSAIGPDQAFTPDLVNNLFRGLRLGPADYVRVRTSTGVHAFEMAEKEDGNTIMLNGLDQGAGAHTLFATQYFFGPEARSSLAIVNLDSIQSTVHLRLMGLDGQQIGVVRTLPISPNGKIHVDDPQFFEIPEHTGQDQGYVEIGSEDVRLAGNVTFSDRRRQISSSSLPLVSSLQDSVLLSNMAHDDLLSTSVTLLNPGDNDVSAAIELFTAEGKRIATAADTLSPRQSKSRTVLEYFPTIVGPHWVSGYVVIRADAPITAFSPVEMTGAGSVSAIPPQQIQ